MISSNATGCIDVKRVHSPVITLDVIKERDLFGMGCFFEDHFKWRDRCFHNPGNARHESLDGVERFNFDWVELGEAFLGEYDPKHLSDFLMKHLKQENELGEIFANKLFNYDGHFRRVLEYCLWSSTYALWPLSISGEELSPILDNLPAKYFSKIKAHYPLSQCYFPGESEEFKRIGLKNRLRLDKHRDALKEKLANYEPPIVLCQNNGGPSLDPISFIRYYDQFNPEGIEIIKR